MMVGVAALETPTIMCSLPFDAPRARVCRTGDAAADRFPLRTADFPD
jgi:hypothetical protein